MSFKGHRMTNQRRTILEVLKETTSHPTADWIYDEVKQKIPNISLGTIYRNLNLLAESGQILELNYTNTQTRFDGNPSPHYHFICQECGRVYDLALELQPQLDMEAEQISGHRIDFHRLEFYGICQECLTHDSPPN